MTRRACFAALASLLAWWRVPSVPCRIYRHDPTQTTTFIFAFENGACLTAGTSAATHKAHTVTCRLASEIEPSLLS